VIVTEAVPVHPFVPVPVTLYVPICEIVIVGVVAPVLHKYVLAPLAVSVIELVPHPSSVVFGKRVITTVGGVVLDVIVILAVAVQPLAAVPVTVYVPAVVMVLVAPVPPPDQE
jgi:hypothetical protein